MQVTITPFARDRQLYLRVAGKRDLIRMTPQQWRRFAKQVEQALKGAAK